LVILILVIRICFEFRISVFEFFNINVETSSLNLFINEIGPQLGLGGQDIRLIAASILNIVFSLIGIISIVLVIRGGFIWYTSGGNEDEIKKARNTLLSGVVGLIIVLTSYSLARYILSALLTATTIY